MSKKYISPSKDAWQYTCPHCNTMAQMQRDTHQFSSDFYNTPEGFRVASNELTIHKCVCCGSKIIWVDDVYIYPDIVAEDPNPDMPESVAELYNEAGLIYNKSPRAACALLRLAIDRLCRELGETDRDLNKNIAALVAKGLSKTVQQALDLVRVVGNKAVHPGQIGIDVDDVQTARVLMGLLNMIVERMISEPKRMEDLYDLLPESAKESINKRDL